MSSDAVTGGAPSWVAIAAACVVVAALLPVIYLFVRGIQGGDTTFELPHATQIRSQVIWRTTTVIVLVTVCFAYRGSSGCLVDDAHRPAVPPGFSGRTLAMPLVVPSFVMATTLIEALGPKGSLQGTFGAVGRRPVAVDLRFARERRWFLVLMTYPYVYLTVRAAIAGLNPELVEAGRSMGYTLLGAFRRITLPMLIPAIGSGAVLAALYTLSDYGGVALMRHNTLTVSIMTNYQTSIDRTAGAALSMLLVAYAVALAVGRDHLEGVGGDMTTLRVSSWSDAASGEPWLVDCTRDDIRPLLPIIAGCSCSALMVLFEWLDPWFFEGARRFTDIGAALGTRLQASGLAAVATIVIGVTRGACYCEVSDTWFSAVYSKRRRTSALGCQACRGGPISRVSSRSTSRCFAYQTLLLLVFAYASVVPAGRHGVACDQDCCRSVRI